MEASNAGSDVVVEVYLIRHGESTANVHPSIGRTTLQLPSSHISLLPKIRRDQIVVVVGGRSLRATLTTNGAKQAKALGEYLRDYLQLHLDAVYASTLVRAYDTAIITCAELDIPEQDIHVADELQEQSQGDWEGRPRADIFTPEVRAAITSSQPDFCAPGGESQRQVEVRMRRFVDKVVKQQIDEAQGLARTGGCHFASPREAEGLDTGSPGAGSAKQSEQQLREDELSASLALLDLRNKGFGANRNGNGSIWVSHHPSSNLASCSNERRVANGVPVQEVSPFHASKVSDASAAVEERPAKVGLRRKVAIFGHGMAIKCFLRGLLQSDASMTHKIFLENTSITLVKFTLQRGWHITKVNDTAHLILARKNRVAEKRGLVLPGAIYRYGS